MAKVSIALVGRDYYLCGPGGNNLKQASSREFADVFDHSHNRYIHHKYVAIGENGCYYLRFVDERENSPRTTWSLSCYPGLAEHLRSDANGDPICVSLGENGHYFIRDAWGAAWNLPAAILEHIDIDNDNDPIDHLFLGKDDSYFAQTRSGAARWNFKGNYGSLERTIKYAISPVRCLGMNLQDDRNYFVLFKDTRTPPQGNPGRGHGLTYEAFQRWAQRFGN